MACVLSLLRQHRQRRPLNGLIVAVSVEDVLKSTPDSLERLAKRLRERIQEAHDLLELRLPIYLVFTKCDLIPGFTHFYRQLDNQTRGEVMGKTFAHEGFRQSDWGKRFTAAMGELVDHWQQIADQQLVQQDIQLTRQDPAAYRFPLELTALKPLLETFVTDLLRANPYQSAELLRGFYFTSALDADKATQGLYAQHITERFALADSSAELPVTGQTQPMFINSLFQKVIIPDQHLVALYTSNRSETRRKGIWIGTAALAGLLLCVGWGVSYSNNKAAIQAISGGLVAAQQKTNTPAANTPNGRHWINCGRLHQIFIPVTTVAAYR